MKYELCRSTEVPNEGARLVEFFGRQALEYRGGGAIRADLNMCTHSGGPLGLRDNELVCQWHGARFEYDTGVCTHGPAYLAAKTMLLPTRLEGDAIQYVMEE